MNAVEFNRVGKTFPGAQSAALEDVSFSLSEAEIHAVLGENGAGKSTLLKILFGLVKGDFGQCKVFENILRPGYTQNAMNSGLAMVQQHFTLVPTLTILENIFLGIEPTNSLFIINRKKEVERLLQLDLSILNRLELDKKVAELAIGEQQQVEILKALVRRPKVLILDEPTAVLVPHEIEELFSLLKGLKKQGVTVIVVTHKIDEVLKHCDTYHILRRGKYIASGKTANASAEQIIDQMIGESFKLKTKHVANSSAECLLECRSIKTAKIKVENLKIHRGEILGIAGIEGSGQADLVDILIGIQNFSGEIWYKKNICKGRIPNLGLISEDRHRQSLWLDESVAINAEMKPSFNSRKLTLNHSALNERAAIGLKKADVRYPNLSTPVRALSGGNQQKLVFYRELEVDRPELLIAHHPTRGVDIKAKDQIHKWIEDHVQSGGSAILLSSEIEELILLCDRIIVFKEGRIITEVQRNRVGFNAHEIGRKMIGGNNER